MRVLLCLLVTMTLALHTPAHGVHSTLTTVDYISKTKELQVTMVVVGSDLQDYLRDQTRRPIEIDRTPDAEKLIFASVKKWFEVRDQQGRPLPLSWVGMEVKASYTALYFETKADSINGVKLRNRALFDWLPDQVNQVTVRKDQTGKTSDHQFKAGTDTWSEVKL